MNRYDIPDWHYYETGLAAVWDRARSSQHYAKLPSFTAEAFRSLLLTDKSDVKKDPWKFTTLDLNKAFRYYETTGTSGNVTPTPRTREDVDANVNSVASAWQRFLSSEDRVLSLLPSDIVPVGDLIAGVSEKIGAVHTRAYPYSTGISDWERVFSLWRSFRPTTVFGAPGVIRELSKIAMLRGTLMELASSVKVVLMLGEVTSDALRSKIASWWDCVAVNASYGSTETGTLAAGCRLGRLHLLVNANYFEVCTKNGDLIQLNNAILEKPNALVAGRLVVTPLNGFARPLLRYDTGDKVTIGEPCGCENKEPSIRIHGRSSDVLALGGRGIYVEELEELIYQNTSALGYMVQLDDFQEPSRARILLERQPSNTSDTEDSETGRLIEELKSTVATVPLDAVWLNNLPANSRSGAALKSWKASNVRVGEW